MSESLKQYRIPKVRIRSHKVASFGSNLNLGDLQTEIVGKGRSGFPYIDSGVLGTIRQTIQEIRYRFLKVIYISLKMRQNTESYNLHLKKKLISYK